MQMEDRQSYMIKNLYTLIDMVIWVYIEIESYFYEYCMEQNAKQTEFYGQGYVYSNRDIVVYFQTKKV